MIHTCKTCIWLRYGMGSRPQKGFYFFLLLRGLELFQNDLCFVCMFVSLFFSLPNIFFLERALLKRKIPKRKENGKKHSACFSLLPSAYWRLGKIQIIERYKFYGYYFFCFPPSLWFLVYFFSSFLSSLPLKFGPVIYVLSTHIP